MATGKGRILNFANDIWTKNAILPSKDVLISLQLRVCSPYQVSEARVSLTLVSEARFRHVCASGEASGKGHGLAYREANDNRVDELLEPFPHHIDLNIPGALRVALRVRSMRSMRSNRC